MTHINNLPTNQIILISEMLFLNNNNVDAMINKFVYNESIDNYIEKTKDDKHDKNFHDKLVQAKKIGIRLVDIICYFSYRKDAKNLSVDAYLEWEEYRHPLLKQMINYPFGKFQRVTLISRELNVIIVELLSKDGNKIEYKSAKLSDETYNNYTFDTIEEALIQVLTKNECHVSSIMTLLNT